MRIGLLALLSGCCGGPPAAFTGPLDPVYLDGGSVTVDLARHVADTRHEIAFRVSDDPDLVEEMDGTRLTITPQPGWRGTTSLRIALSDDCGGRDTAWLEVHGGAASTATGACRTTLTHRPQGPVEGVAVAGAWNDWSPTADPMADQGDGSWTVTLDLPEGAYPYKLVEFPGGAFGGDGQWLCDPAAPYIQCDPGYKEPWDTDWTHTCAPGVESCNSLLIVPPCGPPSLAVSELSIDRAARAVRAVVEATPGAGGDVASATATLDGAPLDGAWTGDRFEVDLDGLSAGRHTLRFQVEDAAGNPSDEAWVPFWLDQADPDAGLMYFAFVDRVANGRPDLDGSEGATANTGDYAGGDLDGLRALLPYLDDLGVTVLWLSNMQDNAEGAWPGDCGRTYAAYHAYWPDAPRRVEEHFGDDAALRALIDDAHARGMRVVMDLVLNHVHQDHPYFADHPEWFNPYEDCEATVGSQLNFDRIPETCWFSPYLPDFDTSHPDVLRTLVDDALWWARTYELDGFRADAVKHMSHAVTWNLASAVARQVEHRDAGGDEDFYMVGETFDGDRARIAAYVGPDQLDGQFDFPLYFALRDGFISGAAPLSDVLAAVDASRAAYGDARMSTFLGNHDVPRFVTEAAEGWQDPCYAGQIRNAAPPADPWPTDRLKLAWTALFTSPGLPLVYYGDELGVPGYGDPDNRQPLWWHTGGDLAGVDSVDAMAARVSPQAAGVLRHVKALADARAAHPALVRGARVEWWDEWDLHAYALGADGDHALVLLNRSGADRQLVNGLSFAGLPTGGTWRDVLTGDTFLATGDQLAVDVPANGSRVLVAE